MQRSREPQEALAAERLCEVSEQDTLPQQTIQDGEQWIEAVSCFCKRCDEFRKCDARGMSSEVLNTVSC